MSPGDESTYTEALQAFSEALHRLWSVLWAEAIEPKISKLVDWLSKRLS